MFNCNCHSFISSPQFRIITTEKGASSITIAFCFPSTAMVATAPWQMCYLPLLTHLGQCWYLHWSYLLTLSQQSGVISRDGKKLIINYLFLVFWISGQDSCSLTGAWAWGQRGQSKADLWPARWRAQDSLLSLFSASLLSFFISVVGIGPSYRPELTDPYTFPAACPRLTLHSLGATFTMFSRYKSRRLKQLW